MDYLNIIDTTQPDYIKPHIIQHFKSLEGEGGNNAVEAPPPTNTTTMAAATQGIQRFMIGGSR